MKGNFTYLVNILFIVLLSVYKTSAQTPAFPGAEGAGKYTSGGRGTTTVPTTVFEVTNLTDVNSPGSLRYACSQSVSTYPYRTIIFRVSGTIRLTSRLSIPQNTTIAGQTAPGDGICIADYPVVISGDNVIIRYIRCRMGDRYQNKGMIDGGGSDDALGSLEHNNIIIDHCSVSWSTDEALTVYRGDNLTLQWNLISEPLNYSYHFETGDTDFEHHGYGGIWGAKHASFHHNLIAHCKNRTPRFAGVSTYSPAVQGGEMCDFRNNVIYDWGINNVYGGEGGYYNIVNNYYKYGPNTTSRRYQVVAVDYSDAFPYAKYYLKGNYVDGSSTNTANNWLSVTMKSGNLADTTLSKVTEPFDLPAIPAETAESAYASVLAGAGASFKRDTLDQRIINDVKNRTGKLIDVQGGFPHGTDYSVSYIAWPALVSTTAPTDTDHDGMPDDWETANGLNKDVPADRNTRNTDGYTMLEVYLNSIATTTSGTIGGSTGNTGGTGNTGTSSDATATWSLATNADVVTTGDITGSAQIFPSSWTIAYTTSSAQTTGLYANQTVAVQRAKPTAGWPSNQTAPDETQYSEYKVAPVAGKKLTISKLSFDFGDAGSTSTMKANIYYSLDGFTSTRNLLNSSPLTLPKYSATELLTNVTFNDLNIAVPAGKTLSVRVYPWWTSTTSTSKYLVQLNVVFTGTTATVLPLNFLSFTAKAERASKGVKLTWTTTNEENTQNFVVERKSGGDFTTIGAVDAKNTSGEHFYSFVDYSAQAGINYYRLKQLDKDGKFTYSSIASADSRGGVTLAVYPSPANGSSVSVSHPVAENASLKVVTLSGTTVSSTIVAAGSTSTTVDISGLAAGYYLAFFTNGSEKATVKFVKR